MDDAVSRIVGLVLVVLFLSPYVFKVSALPLTLVIVGCVVILIADVVIDMGIGPWGRAKQD